MDAAGLDCAHTFRLMTLANEDGFARVWEMGDGNPRPRAFRRKTLHQLLADHVRLKLLTVSENEQLTDELNDRAAQRADGSPDEIRYPMIWTFEKLIEQQKHELSTRVINSMWQQEKSRLNRELAELYPCGLEAQQPGKRPPAPMVYEYWRRLAEATAKLVAERCS